MGLQVGSAYARLGARLDDDGFDRFRRRLDAARRDARNDIEAEAKLDVDRRGFGRWKSQLDDAGKHSKRFATVTAGAFATVATGAAGLAVAGGVAFAALAKHSVDAASDINESLSKNRVLFGDYAKDIETFAKTSAANFGISRQAALEFTGTFGNLFRALGVGQKEAAGMTPPTSSSSPPIWPPSTTRAWRTPSTRSGPVSSVRPSRSGRSAST